MTVYLEAIWLLNFLFDWILLLFTKGLMKDKTKQYQILLGAFVASLITPVQLLFSYSILMHPLSKFLFSCLIILVAFKWETFPRYAQLLGYFYFVSFLFGGALFASYYFLDSTLLKSTLQPVMQQTAYGDPVSWLFILLCLPIAYLFLKQRLNHYGTKKIYYEQYCETLLSFQGKTITTIGYIDSGNQLIDPLTNQPVIIGDEIILRNWFKKEELIKFKRAIKTLDLKYIPKAYLEQFRFIPYQGVSGEQQFMLAIKLTDLSLVYNGQVIQTERVLLGMQFAKMHHEGGYHCLLHPALFKDITENIA